MITMEDVAHLAGVSKMTVSRCINDTGPVSAATRERILRAVNQLGYKPQAAPRLSVQGSLDLFMLVVPDISNPFFSFIAEGMESVANHNGYQVMILNSGENLDKERELLKMAAVCQVSGVLIAPVSDKSRDNILPLQQRQIPFVFVDREVDGVEADVVKGDIANAAEHLVTYLADLGHTRIGIVTGHLDVKTGRDRLEGYQRALRRFHLPYRQEYVRQAIMTRDVTPTFVDELLCLEQPPTALFAANSFQYAQTLQRLQELGMTVPGDMSLVSFRNSADLSGCAPTATSAIQPSYNFGSLGAQLLIERIEGSRHSPTRIVLQSTFMEGTSTGRPQ